MNDYFHPTISTFGKGSLEGKEKLEVYPEKQESVESAPKEEPQEGFTSIIIPAYFNNYALFHQTGNCIGSIREHTDPVKTPYEIILVINGKTDIKFADLKQTFADKVIQSENNEGWAKAVNKGIRVAKGEFIALINNDAQVYDYWLEDLQESLKAGLDLVMGNPMYGMPFARAVESFNIRQKQLEKPIEETFVDFNDFSCVLTTKALFMQLGLFDEDFFMYGEDIDFLRRMDKEGKKHASTKRVAVHHIIGSTSMTIKETPEIMNESKEKLRLKWGF